MSTDKMEKCDVGWRGEEGGLASSGRMVRWDNGNTIPHPREFCKCCFLWNSLPQSHHLLVLKCRFYIIQVWGSQQIGDHCH